MAAFVKSALWVIGCGGVGYLLLEATANTPNEEYLSKVRKVVYSSDVSIAINQFKSCNLCRMSKCHPRFL